MRKKNIITMTAAIFIAAAIGAIALAALVYFCNPMEDLSYDLSLSVPDGAVDPLPDKGWTVFTDNRGKRKELTDNGFGVYKGLDYPGQTFYASRKLVEKLDSPTLSVSAVNWTISVFLDDTLIYTDCPDADNRIGYLELPMLDYDRSEKLTISLPLDYSGKTLVIAQSSPLVSETLGSPDIVYPCLDVHLYCGYSYESSLIADASKTTIPCAILFTIGIFILAIFLWYAANGNFIAELPLLALTIFFFMLNILDNAINAASAPGITEPYIKLDLMCKNKYFFFSCENSAANGSADPEKPPAPEHGHGLKIIKQIVKNHGDIMSIEQSENAFKISIALPI